jgi:hypothetical protein
MASFDVKEFCAKSLVVVGVVSCIPAVGSALVALLYCWILWPPSWINASNYLACLLWLVFVSFGVFLVVKWGCFARDFNTSRGSAWLWIISAGYCGIVLLGLLAWGYYLHNARRFDLRDWQGDELDPELSVIFFVVSAAPLYAGILCVLLLFLSRPKHSRS